MSYTKQELNRLFSYPLYLKSIKQRQDDIRNAVSISKTSMDKIGYSTSNHSDRFADAIEKLEKLDRKYLDMVLRYEESEQNLLKEIGNMSEPYHSIIQLKYIKRMKLTDIEKKLLLPKGSVYKYHHEALEHLGVK